MNEKVYGHILYWHLRYVGIAMTASKQVIMVTPPYDIEETATTSLTDKATALGYEVTWDNDLLCTTLDE